MIFSLSQNSSGECPWSLANTDIFCFFHSQNATRIPESYWGNAVAASLKLKRNVLILESPESEVPSIDSSLRWQMGGQFLHLAPRSLSVFLEAYAHFSGSYPSIKGHLTTFK